MDDDEFALEILSNLPKNSAALTRLHYAPISVADADPTVSPPRKTVRLDDQETPSRSKGKGKERENDPRSMGINSSKFRVFRVKNSIPRGTLPQVFTNELAPLITRSITIILNQEMDPSSAPGSYEQLYEACNIMVSLKQESEELYKAVEKSLKLCAGRILDDRYRRNETGMAWLALFMEGWEWYENRLTLMHSIFLHLDRGYVHYHRDKGKLPVRDLGRLVWRDSLQKPISFHSRITAGVVEWVTQERNQLLGDGASTMDMDMNQTGARAVIQSLVAHLSLSMLYPFFFEDIYVNNTRQYFAAERSEKQVTLSPSDYVLYCATRLEQEELRLSQCCPEFSWGTVTRAVEDTLIRNDTQTLATPAIAKFMNEKDILSLSKMYRLYSRVQSLSGLRDAFKSYVREAVVAIVTDTARDASMITSLIDLKSFVDKTVVDAFQGRNVGTTRIDQDKDTQFEYAAKDAFESGFAQRKNKPAEMMAKYLDFEMRQGQRGASDQEFQEKVNAALGLYGFTTDHDVFRIFYMRALAKRLLLQRSASDDIEKSFLVKLGKGFDPEFEKGLKMFADLESSREFAEKFHRTCPEHSNFTTMVLQPSAWPTYSPVTIRLPPFLQTSIDKFTNFYRNERKDRKLSWAHSLGTVTLITRFPSGEKELSLSLHQAVVMLLFEDNVNKLKFSDILEETGIEKNELKRTLQSLALGKKRVLVKKPPGKDVNTDDEFLFNLKFEDEKRNIRINTIQVQETAEEHQATSKYIAIDRTMHLDSAVVRIMKGKKKLTYQDLINAVIEAVGKRFHPVVADIKKRIDDLVEKEYLRRDEADTNLFHYVA